VRLNIKREREGNEVPDTEVIRRRKGVRKASLLGRQTRKKGMEMFKGEGREGPEPPRESLNARRSKQP